MVTSQSRVESECERKCTGVSIKRYEQFLLFPQCFQKACFPEASKGVIVWKWVKQAINHLLTLYQIILGSH